MLILSNRFDAALNAQARNHDKTKPWLRTKRVTSEEEQQAFWDNPSFTQKYWTLENTQTKELVGIVGFTDITANDAEFSCLIYPGYRKQGFGQQGLRLLFNYGFKSLGFNRIYGWTYGYDNTRSSSSIDGSNIALGKLGMAKLNPAAILFIKMGMEIYGPCLWPQTKEKLEPGKYVWRLELQRYDYERTCA